MSLRSFASREICLAGMAGEAWNESGVSHRIMELIISFAAGEHSGGSAGATLAVLEGMGWKRALEQPMRLAADGPVEHVLGTFKDQSYRRPEDAEFAFARFLHLARFRPLGPGGDLDPASFQPSVEFANDVTEYCDMRGSKQVVYQSARCPTVFSADSGKTWYDLDRPGWAYPAGCTPTPMPGNA